MMEANIHCPVLKDEVIEGLNILADGVYIDATFGRGGHSQAILDKLSDAGRLIALDRDPDAVQAAQLRFADDKRFTIEHVSFGRIAEVANQLEVSGQVNGVFVDLGVSSPQLDTAERGFSFMRDGPLDMRMDPSSGQSAAKWLETVDEQDLANVLYEYGEERYSRRIARAIVTAREEAAITSTLQLAEIVSAANPRWEKSLHPATRSFQAIRIHINNELEELRSVLAQGLEILAKNGRMVMISFHSLEDRMVKRFMRDNSRDTLPPNLPIKASDVSARMKLISRAIHATDAEIQQNPRSRSAVLRIGEKLQ